MNEQEIVDRLISTAGESGIQSDPNAIVNFYVALKSKPMAILTGPMSRGKVALVESLMRVLTGGDPIQCQKMDGHAWWAGESGNVGFCTDAQTRFNTTKILCLVEEALQPENARRVFMACLTRISPAELNGFFSEVAFQIQHERLMRLPYAHLTEPLPYPPNLFLIGTMDTAAFDWSNVDLLSGATIIDWRATPVNESQPCPEATSVLGDSEDVFLESCIRNKKAACLKLHRVLGRHSQFLQPLFHIKDALAEYGVRISRLAMEQVIIYLANAWTREGYGLFDSEAKCNLAISLDWAMAQIVLRHAEVQLRDSAALRQRLQISLDGQFAHSKTFLEGLI